VFEFLSHDPICRVFWHPDSALREVRVVGRAGVDMARVSAASLRVLFDPSNRDGVHVLLAGHWQLVAASYASDEHQHSKDQIDRCGELDVFSHGQNTGPFGN